MEWRLPRSAFLFVLRLMIERREATAFPSSLGRGALLSEMRSGVDHPEGYLGFYVLVGPPCKNVQTSGKTTRWRREKRSAMAPKAAKKRHWRKQLAGHPGPKAGRKPIRISEDEGEGSTEEAAAPVAGAASCGFLDCRGFPSGDSGTSSRFTTSRLRRRGESTTFAASSST
jgi:hypothetical protein